MKDVSINISEEVKKVFPENLNKTLQDNEVICPTCKGLNISKFKRVTDKLNSEIITMCHDCDFGIIKICKHCGGKLEYERCNCDGFKKEMQQKDKIRFLEVRKQKIIKATECDFNSDTFEYLYDDETDRYYSCVDEFIEEHYQNGFCKDDYNEIKYLWLCKEVKISLDATSIIEDACENLHDDAYDQCDIDELQKLLDNWCKKQEGATSYYPDYKKYIKVEKEWFEEYVKNI